MTLRDWIPPQSIGFAKLLRARLRYRDCRIASGNIASDVHLSASCAIYENCEIGHGVTHRFLFLRKSGLDRGFGHDRPVLFHRL